MSAQATEGKEVWPMKMSSSLGPGPVLWFLLFLAQSRNWIIALHTTGRPAAQPLTQVITEDGETQTESYNNSLHILHREIGRKLITAERLQFSISPYQRSCRIEGSNLMFQHFRFQVRPERYWSSGATEAGALGAR